MTKTKPVRIGFIPLVDAAALLVAVDKGFAANEGLDVELIREVSWSNIRDKLALGMFGAAHLLTPIAIASNLRLGNVNAPLVAPVNLAMNGNAITVSPALLDELRQAAEGDIASPAASARALRKIAQKREAQGREPLTFGMTFPFSTHNYVLRFWMAEGGLDPDQDLRLVVLPPPFMAASLAQGHVDGFCVGAPWSSVAVDAGVGVILHFSCEIFTPVPEKVLALRESAAKDDPELVAALTRAVTAGAGYVDDAHNRAEVSALLARPDRVGVEAEMIGRTLEGRLRVDAAGAVRAKADYLIIGEKGACRPDPNQAAWLYAQMLRWGQARFSQDLLAAAKTVMRADLYDAALGFGGSVAPERVIDAFSGRKFNAADISAYLKAFAIGANI